MRNKTKANMRSGYVSAAVMTVLLGLSAYAVIIINNKVKDWWKGA